MRLVDRDQLELTIRRFFESSPRGALAVYLFGSRARDRARPDSDVDLGVLFEEEPGEGFASLPLELEADLVLELRLPVQVVALNRAPADLVHRIFMDGRLLLDRDPSRRIAFEVRLRNEYFDLQPLLREYRNARPRPT